jgi:DNA-binding transcriptional ArsR family regulator
MSTGNGPSEAPAWSAAFFSLIHPAKVAIVEALERTGEPMSAVALYYVLDGEWSFGTVAYHVRRLAERGVLEERFQGRVRGATEHFFGLAG